MKTRIERQLLELFPVTRPSSRRFEKGRLNTPPGVKPVHGPIVIGTEPFTQFPQAGRYSANCEHSIPSRVSVLLNPGGPHAVGWIVITVCIDSLKRPPSFAFPHIFKEVFKRVFPARTNHNASTAIILKPFVTRIRATLNHCLPSLIYRRGAAPVFGVRGR